jgi:hypothetical protein
MILSVYQNPFRIMATALDQNGNSLGSYSASDMTNLAFNNINYLCFGVLESGGNYTVGNISGTNIPIPSTPTPTPTPAPTPTQSLLPTPMIAISCQSSTSYSNFNVEINGNITSDGVSLSGVSILLSYSVNEGNSWNDLTTVSADSSGSFSAVWLPSVTGNYLLRATYIGNSNYSETSTTVNFAVLPFEDQSVFSVTSNSTLSGFAFNSTSNQISFTVSGPSGTTGYVNVCISKTLIADISNVQVFLDGTQISYSVQQQTDSWIISFQYHHSTHQININLNSALSTSTSSPNEKLPEQSFIYVIIAVAIVFVIAVSLIVRRKRNKNLSPKI